MQNSIKRLLKFQNDRHLRLCNMIFGYKMPKDLKIKLENERTCGIEVDTLKCDGIGISIWDMVGQLEYHSFHDLVVPKLSAIGSCYLFLFFCNLLENYSFKKRSISTIKAEMEYWLQFIASNTMRSRSYCLCRW